jgi:hypothetical protein
MTQNAFPKECPDFIRDRSIRRQCLREIPPGLGNKSMPIGMLRYLPKFSILSS